MGLALRLEKGKADTSGNPVFVEIVNDKTTNVLGREFSVGTFSKRRIGVRRNFFDAQVILGSVHIVEDTGNRGGKLDGQDVVKGEDSRTDCCVRLHISKGLDLVARPV